MTPAESRDEQIAVELLRRVREISSSVDGGAKYWYTVTHAIRVDDFLIENLRPEAAYDLIYELAAGDVYVKEETTEELEVETEMFLLISKKWRPNTQNAWGIQPPIRWTIQNRLVRDFKVRLLEDVSLKMAGGEQLCTNLEVRDENRKFIVDQEHLWAQVELRLVATYTYLKDAP
jgi:hypothetical protein